MFQFFNNIYGTDIKIIHLPTVRAGVFTFYRLFKVKKSKTEKSKEVKVKSTLCSKYFSKILQKVPR